MNHRISILATQGRLLKLAGRKLGNDMGGPWRSLTLRTPKTPPFAARPRYYPISSPKKAQAVLAGTFAYQGGYIDLGSNETPWATALPSESFAASVHSFDWLHDLSVLGEAKAGARARQLVDAWIESFGEWNSFSWQADILAARCFALLSCWGAVLAGDQNTAPSKTAARRASLARQITRLKKTLGQTRPGLARLKAVSALALGGAMLGDTGLLDRNLDRLDDELMVQVLGDGSHIGRNPASALLILQMLFALEDALKIRGIEGSKQTRRAIDRLTPSFAFFNPGDGGLASFNGGGEGDAKVIKAMVKHAGEGKSRPFAYMPHGGYQRLEKGETIVLVDCGQTPPRPYDTGAALAPLAFEMSVSGKRMVVNCGYNDSHSENWRHITRETAAHSTLIIDDCSAGEIATNGTKYRAFGPVITRGVDATQVNRKEQDGDIWIEASHEGYRAATGLIHRRRLYMVDGGYDVRGEDSLSVPMGAAPMFKGAQFPFTIRFHLHPDVRATLSRDGKSALIILPGGEGWRFRTDSGALKLERSIYLARANKPEPCEQIIIHGSALSDNNGDDKSNRVRWSFRRVPTEV